MLDIAFGFVALFFGIFGAVGLIRLSALRITAPKRVKNRVYAVRLTGENADIELQMAIETVKWDPVLSRSACFAIDCGINDEIKDICKSLCETSPFSFVSEKEFSLLF